MGWGGERKEGKKEERWRIHVVTKISFLFFFSFIYFFLILNFFFFKFYFIFKLYIIVLVLPNIKMNPPQVYMCSPS